MKQEILEPDYQNCILNLIDYILKMCKAETMYKGLPQIDNLSKNNY